MDNQILLDFTKKDYSDEAICDSSELVNRVQFYKLNELIEEQIQEAKNNETARYVDDNMLNYHVHNTISIFGNRGAGKTTFLRTALKEIKEKHSENVAVLKLIDPSIIECKQNPFINLIALIHEYVQGFIDQGCLQNRHDKGVHCYDDYQETYKRLLKGLPFIDGVGNDNSYIEWDDDLYVSIQGMERAEASNNLVSYFKEYIDESLHLLNKTCFILPFDDIDTNSQKGFQILEIIRKYLVTNKIITILTGDLDLYSNLVRKASWESFDLELLNKECDYAHRKKDEFAHMVNHLESQYLLKILKPTNRIHLKTIREILSSKESYILVKTSKEDTYSLNICYRELLKNIGFDNVNLRVITAYVNFLETLSVRTQIRILKLYSDYCLVNEKNHKHMHRNEFIEKFVNIFWTDIKQKSSDAKSLIYDSPFYPLEMMKFLIDTNSLDTCSDFVPHTSDEILNKALVAISAQFSKNVNTSGYIILDYWLRISYIKYVIESFKGHDQSKYINELVKFSTILEHDDLTKCIGLVEAYSRGIYKTLGTPTKTFPGTIIIPNTEQTNGSQYKTLLEIVTHGTMNQQNDSIQYASIYKLMAILRDFMYHYKDSDEYHQNLFKGYNQKLVRKLSQYREYLEPTFEKQNTSVEKFNTQYKSKTENYLSGFGATKINELTDWYVNSSEFMEEETDMSPQFLNRIFTRAYFTMINIDKDTSYINLGQKFNAYIVAFLNAVLVESYFDRPIKELIDLDNSNEIEYTFLRNYSKYHRYYKCILLEYLINCPLIKLFMDPFYYRLCTIDRRTYIREEDYAEIILPYQAKIKMASLKLRLTDYSQLLDNILSAINWGTKFRINMEGEEEPKSFLFSLKPLVEETMYLDSRMAMNTIMEKVEYLSRLTDKVAITTHNIQMEIDHLQKEVARYSAKKEERFINQDDTYEFEKEFYQYLCNISI